MTCTEFRTRAATWLDGELDAAETLALDAHAAGCARCRSLAEAERGFRLLALVLRPGSPPPVIGQLVDKHIAYAQLESPAEFVSTDRREVGEWFGARAGLRVTVPDYSPAGIRLVGGRVAEVGEQRAAWVIYEKGRTLMSVFIAPVAAGGPRLEGTRVSFRGHEYLTSERKGYRTVSWTDGPAVFGLVSMLDYQALLECADRLRLTRAEAARL
ncbi:MAG: zf-HC2 domain-containing protein [Candidatus Rokubacteria bacterium]|nr:zf-HC2 domain-containing protein [Candidatus Rokubacteria bacterium]